MTTTTTYFKQANCQLNMISANVLDELLTAI